MSGLTVLAHSRHCEFMPLAWVLLRSRSVEWIGGPGWLFSPQHPHLAELASCHPYSTAPLIRLHEVQEAGPASLNPLQYWPQLMVAALGVSSDRWWTPSHPSYPSLFHVCPSRARPMEYRRRPTECQMLLNIRETKMNKIASALN